MSDKTGPQVDVIGDDYHLTIPRSEGAIMVVSNLSPAELDALLKHIPETAHFAAIHGFTAPKQRTYSATVPRPSARP